MRSLRFLVLALAAAGVPASAVALPPAGPLTEDAPPHTGAGSRTTPADAPVPLATEAPTEAPAAEEPAADPDPVGTDEAAADEDELLELRAVEQEAIFGGTGGLLRHSLLRLGAGNPWRSRLSDPLLGEHEGGPGPDEDVFAGLPRGSLPFPIDSVVDKYDIPVEYNEKVADYLAFFQGPGRKWYSRWLARSSRYVPLFREILREHGVPEDLVYLSMIESGFSTGATSWARAAGQWQFIEATGRLYGLRNDFWVDERRDPVRATHAAARFLKRLHKDFGDWYLAWGAYNGGPARMKKAIDKEGSRDFWELAKTRSLRNETKGYVPKLIAAALIAKHPALFGFPEDERQLPLPFEQVEISEAIDLTVAARCAGVELDEVKVLNPELRRWATPPVAKNGKPYPLRLPAGTRERFLAELEKVPAQERLASLGHRVQKGDTLSKLAATYGASIEAIVRANSLQKDRRITPGQDLVIPVQPGTKPETFATRARVAELEATPHFRGPTAKVQPAEGSCDVEDRVDGRRRVLHAVKKGDNLWAIARGHGVKLAALYGWNGIEPSRKVKLALGQAIQIFPEGAPGEPSRTAAPAAGPAIAAASPAAAPGTEQAEGKPAPAPAGDDTVYHVLGDGETLGHVALRFRCKVDDLKRWNGIRDVKRLQIGQRLRVR